MAKRSTKTDTTKPVESIRHKDKRKNIPTEELRDFVAEDEQAPKTMLYPRDPSLDPQLVWKGKDEQDRQEMAVPVVPIYIQEKIHPQAIIDDFCQSFPSLVLGGDGRQETQLDLFADFNGLPDEFDQRVDFYHHDAHWSNRMILGDSLLVMTSLAEKEGLKGKVQCIYFDPPYGIKFGSNWQVSTRKRDVKDGKAEDATRQPEQVRAFRDTWKMGVHSYLAYLRDRLVVARELLTETGSVFVQIGDENVHLVRSVMDEVFGSENAFGMITFAKTGGTTGRYLACTADHLLAYAKNIDNLKYRALYRMKQVGAEGAQGYTSLELPDGARRRLTPDEMANPSSIPQGSRIFALDNLTSPRVREARTGYYPIRVGGREILPRKGEWKTHTEGMQRLVAIRRVEVVGDTPRYVRFLDDFAAFPLTNLWSDTGVAGFASDKRYVVETSSKLIERCLLMTTDPGDLVLDPLCAQAHNGSSVAQSVMWRPAELFDNRRSFVVLNAT